MSTQVVLFLHLYYILTSAGNITDAQPQAICLYGTEYNILAGRYDIEGYKDFEPYYLKRHASDDSSTSLFIYPYNDQAYLIGKNITSSICYYYCLSTDISQCSGSFVACGSSPNAQDIRLDIHCSNYSSNCLSYFDTYSYNSNSSLCVSSDSCNQKWGRFTASYQFTGCHGGYPYYKADPSSNTNIPGYIWHNVGSHSYYNITYCMDDDINQDITSCAASCMIHSTDLLECSGLWIDYGQDALLGYTVITDVGCAIDTQYNDSDTDAQSVCISGTTFNLIAGRYDIGGYQFCRPYYVKKHSDDSTPLYLYPYKGMYYIGYSIDSSACHYRCPFNNISLCSERFVYCSTNTNDTRITVDIGCINYSTNCLPYFDTYSYNSNASLCVFNTIQGVIPPFTGSYHFEGCHEEYPYYKAVNDDIPLYIWHNVGSGVAYCLDDDINMNSGDCAASCIINSINSTDIMECSGAGWIDVDVCCEDPQYTTYHTKAKIYDEFCIWGFDDDDMYNDVYPLIGDYYPINGKYIYGGCAFYGHYDIVPLVWDVVVNKAYYINVNQKSEQGTDIKLYYKQYEMFEWSGIGGRYIIMSDDGGQEYALCSAVFNETYNNDEDVISKCSNNNWNIFPWLVHYPKITIGNCCRDNMYFNSSFCITGSSQTLRSENEYPFNINGYFKYAGCLENEPYWKSSFIRYRFIGKQTLYVMYIALHSIYCIYNEPNTNISVDMCFAVCSEYDIFNCEQQWKYQEINIYNDYNVIISANQCPQNNCIDSMHSNDGYKAYTAQYIEDETLCFFVNNYIASNVQMNGVYLSPSALFEYVGCANDNPFWNSKYNENTLYIFHVYDEKDLLCLTNNINFKSVNTSNLHQNCYAICTAPNVFECEWQLFMYDTFVSLTYDVYFAIGEENCTPNAIPCDYNDYIDRDYCIVGTDTVIDAQYTYRYCYNGWPMFTQKQNDAVTLVRSDVESTQWNIIYNDDVLASCVHQYLPLCTSTEWILHSLNGDIDTNIQHETDIDLFSSFCNEWNEFENIYNEFESLGKYKVKNAGTIIGWILFSILVVFLVYSCVKDVFCRNKKVNKNPNASESAIELSQQFTFGDKPSNTIQKSKDKSKLEKKAANKYALWLKKAWKSKYRIYPHFVIKIGFDIYDLMTDILLSNLWTQGRFTDDPSSEGAYCKIPQLVSLGNVLFYISVIGFSVGALSRVIEVTKCFCVKPQALNVYVTSLQICKIFTEDIGSLIICWLSLLTTSITSGIGFYWYQSFYTSCASITFTLIRIKNEALNKLWIRIAKICGFCLILFSIGILNGFESLTAKDINYAVIVDDYCVMFDMRIPNATVNATFIDDTVNIPMAKQDNDRFSLNCGVETHTRIQFIDGSDAYFDDYAVLSCVINDTSYQYECNLFVEMDSCYTDGCWMGFNDTKICMIQLQFD